MLSAEILLLSRVDRLQSPRERTVEGPTGPDILLQGLLVLLHKLPRPLLQLCPHVHILPVAVGVVVVGKYAEQAAEAEHGKDGGELVCQERYEDGRIHHGGGEVVVFTMARA
jgi:hypothetical protein